MPEARDRTGSPGEVVPETDRYPNGGVRYTGFRLDGEMHGEWAFYRTDGSLMRRGAFDRGRQVGTWTTHDRAGKVIKETTFDAA